MASAPAANSTTSDVGILGASGIESNKESPVLANRIVEAKTALFLMNK